MSALKSSSCYLLDIPAELAIAIASHLKPLDLCSLSRTCQSLHNLIQETDAIWEACYHLIYDPSPRISTLRGRFRNEIQERHRALQLVACKDSELKHQRLEPTLVTLLAIAETAAPSNSKNALILREIFLQKDAERYYLNREPFNAPSTRATSIVNLRAWSSLARRLSQQLHICNGLTLHEMVNTQSLYRESARSVVYGVHSYQTSDCNVTRLDGTVDFKILESLLVCDRIMWQQAMPFWQQQPYAHPSVVQNTFDHVPSPPLLEIRDSRDWAGVSAMWVGTYSFLDYRDWFAFNFIEDSHLAHALEVPGGLMQLKLELVDTTDTDWPDWVNQTTYPPLRFKGVRMMHDGVEGCLRGHVVLGPEGFPLWHIIVADGGVDAWILNGVEISQNGGILGTWTTAERDAQDPIGPFHYCRC